MKFQLLIFPLLKGLLTNGISLQVHLIDILNEIIKTDIKCSENLRNQIKSKQEECLNKKTFQFFRISKSDRSFRSKRY